MQAQNPLDPYYAMWCRLDHFDPDRLGQLLVDRACVRVALMRGTLHLVTTADYWRLQPVFSSVLERVFNSTAFAKDTSGLNRDQLIRLAGTLLGEQPMTRSDLGRQLEQRWPSVAGGSMAQAATYLLPVIQTTPRGVWGKRGAARWVTARSWLGEETWAPESHERIVLRYLAAFGPASVSDIRIWSGLTGLRAVVDDVRDRLRVWRSEDGTELLDLPDAVHPDPETPAPPRFLPEYDNVLLGHADRSRFFGTAIPEGWVGNLLVDGFFVGSWKLEDANRIVITPQEKLPRSLRHDVEAEGHRLLTTLHRVEDGDVRFG